MPLRETKIGSWFWGAQEIPDILDRWGHDLPPERVHLVTVPPPGGPKQLLWKRFSIAFGLVMREKLTGERARLRALLGSKPKLEKFEALVLLDILSKESEESVD